MHLSIRSKLTVAFVLILVPFLFLGFFNIREREAAGRHAIAESLSGSAKTAAATMDAYLAEIIRKQQSAAQLVSGERFASVDEMNAALAQVRAPASAGTVRVLPVPVVIPKLETLSRSLLPFAHYLVYLDARGKVIAADPPTLVGVDMLPWPEVQAVLQQGQVWSNSGFKSDILPTAGDTPGFSICLGARAANQPAAICAGIEAANLANVLPSVPAGDTVVVLDNRGLVIYSSQTATLAAAQRDWSRLVFVHDATGERNGPAEILSPIDGERYIGAQTIISSLGWVMGVYRQQAAALAPVQAQTTRELILLALIIATTLGLGQALGAVLARPIVELTAHARRLARGHLQQQITIATGDETQTLAETFNSMSQSLDRTISDLVQAQQQIARQSEQLQQLLVRTNAVQEDERRRIAFDIHDGVIQLVIASGYELQAAGRDVANGNAEESRRKLQKARQLLDQTVVEMRRIVYDLHPTSLDSRGLIPSLEKYAAAWQESTGIGCTFSVTGTEAALSQEVKVGVYRIVQEALTNIRKHAGASKVAMDAGFGTDRLHVRISDDGSGFSLSDAAASGGHLGLMSMSERARNLGGHLDIDTQPGHGTVIALDVPIA